MTATTPDNQGGAGATAPWGPAEFAAGFAESHTRLWALAAALIGDRTEAEDLVQEAAMVGLRKLGDFTPGTNFAAWMGKIVRMHALNWRRKQAGRRTSPTDNTDLNKHESGEAETSVLTEGTESSAAGELGGLRESFDDEVVRGFGKLATAPRACLLLRIVHDLTYDEIAEMLDIPAGTAMSHVHRAKRQLRESITAADPSIN